MIRKILAAGTLLVGGYLAGVFFGYRAAVVDYVENDGENIERAANDMYPSPSERGERIPAEIVEQMEAKQSGEDTEDESTGKRGFQ